MRCEIITVGTELLLGDVLDTNTQYLAQELAKRGFEILHLQTVGDNANRLEQVLTSALKNSDIIITTGGLGPTADDITKEIAAKVMQKPLYLHEETLNGIHAYFAKTNRVMPKSNRKQALIPQDAVIFPNDHGTAPGVAIENNGKIIICLPGPPRETQAMFDVYVQEYLKIFSTSVIVSHRICTFGIGESAMAQLAGELLDMKNPTVAPYASFSESYLRVTALAETRKQADKLIAPVVQELMQKLGDYVYGVDAESLEQVVVEMLKEQGKTLALAESCTGGLIAKRITDIAGASTVFGYGIVSYAVSAKESLLHVDKQTVETYGVVSEQVAKEMAQGARHVSGADIALAVTGAMGPGADADGNEAGLSFLALASKNKVEVKRLFTGRNERNANRFMTSSHALDMIRRYLMQDLSKTQEGM